jgi:hypothetical protein
MSGTRFLTLALITTCLIACAGGVDQPADTPPILETVWEFPERQLTGVAASAGGRVFVNFPLWGGAHDLSVAEISSERLLPYPSEEWNSWSLQVAHA